MRFCRPELEGMGWLTYGSQKICGMQGLCSRLEFFAYGLAWCPLELTRRCLWNRDILSARIRRYCYLCLRAANGLRVEVRGVPARLCGSSSYRMGFRYMQPVHPVIRLMLFATA